MTTTPGPRHGAIPCYCTVHQEAEARADLDGLVARLQSIANIAHLAWLDPATVPEAFQRIVALAGDKAEAPE